MPKCPLCKKESVKDFKPFCSERCKLIDLNNWLDENYVIQTEESVSNEIDDSEEL